jgi:hypothetical protein
MRKSTIAIGIAAALSTPAFVSPTNANAAVKFKPQRASGPVHSQPHFKYPNHSRPTGSTVLYDQTGTDVNGAPSQNFESAFDQYDAQGADDFVVTDAAGWTLSAFNFVVSATSDPSSATYDIEVLPDNAGFPGSSPVCSYPAAAGVLTSGNTALSVALPTPCVLSQGTYWIEMVVNLDFGVGGQVFWSDYSPGGTGANSKWQNPGGGFGTTCTTWSDLASCVGSTSPVGGGQTAFMFQVVGAVGGGGGGTCSAGDLCLASTVGTDLSSGACGTADTIDATNGDQLNFCYTITNNTGVTLDYHTLENNVDGTLFTLLNQSVPDGGTFQYNHIETVNQSNTYNSTWTGQDVPPGYAAEVTGGGGGGCPDRIFADGFDGSTPPCGPAGGFIDITGTGTPLNNGDDQAIAVTMPFSFNLYGATSNNICVDNNGFLLFNTTSCPSAGLYVNSSLPAASLPAAAIMPLWDDFDSESGNVYTDTRGSTPNRQFIVEWSDRVHFSGSSNSDGATFEVILNEDGTIQFEYADVEYTGGSENPDCAGGVCATIGLQNDSTLFNQFSAFEASVTDNSGILWTPTNPQVFTGTDSVTVNVGQPTIVVNNGNPITGTVPAGGTNSVQFPIANTGNRDLNWSLTEAGPADLHFPPPGSRYAMPMGDPSMATAGKVPLGLRHPNTKPYQPLNRPIHGNGTVPMFAADIYNNQFVTLDALNPGTVNVVAATDGTAWTGGAFVDGDFSKLYVLSGSFAANPDQFATIDTATGAKTVIGSTPSPGGAGWNGMAYDSTTGIMYAVTGCPSGSSLYTIDINTGTPTLVGAMTNEGCSVSIAIDSAGQMYSVDIVADGFFAVDKTNANDSLIGSIGFNANYAQEMTFDLSTDILYYAAFNLDLFGDFMYTVDTGTGGTTLIGQITSGFAELDAMGIETAGGPCSQPQDLPWLSLSPLTGTTAAGDSTPVTASLDGAGTTDGDVLSGTVCATSNDPANRTVATPINVTVGGTGGGSVVDSGVINLTPNPDFTGLYINWLTGDWCTSTGGPCNFAGGYDFNPYNTTLTFFWPSAHTGNCVSDGTSCLILASGATIGPASTFGTSNSANYLAGNTTGFLGFSFINANTSQVNYGYAKFTTGAGSGYPATLVEYWYDNSGAAINIP